MAKYHHSKGIMRRRFLCLRFVIFICIFISSIPFLFWFSFLKSGKSSLVLSLAPDPLDLLSYGSAWNQIKFSESLPSKALRIAVFVKRWPRSNRAGGLERHTLTLHLALAQRGHSSHIFTVAEPNLPSSSESFKSPHPKLHFHFSPHTSSGTLDHSLAWKQFEELNVQQPFDLIHSESVALQHAHARNFSNVVATWHGIAYESIHSDIVQDIVRNPGEPRPDELKKTFAEKLFRIVDEVKFFQDYEHHVAISNHVGDVLKRVYMLEDERVHVIFNGVDEEVFRKDYNKGMNFRRKYGIPENGVLVLGICGRLVKDKGHPLMIEALNQILMESEDFGKKVFLLVAGDGPWGDRYRKFRSNVKVLGPLPQTQLAEFYNAIDIFVNPTLRAQGLDLTLLEAMISGKPVIATRFASITGSVIINSDFGYTFPPTVVALKETLYKVFRANHSVLKDMGENGRKRAINLFTSKKMVTSYERLFLCISHKEEDEVDYCKYPLQLD